MSTRETTVREQVLSEAARLVSGDRAQAYGSPSDNFARVAKLWSAQFGWDVATEDVPQALILLKLARVQNSPGSFDNWLDIAGYASLGAEVTDDKR